MVKVIFYKAEYGNWKDKLISWWTKSTYSHVEVILKDGKCFSADARNNIVRIKDIDYEDGKWDILHVNKKINYREIDKNIGCEYDWKGLFLNEVLKSKIENPKKWYCSEVCSHILGFRNTLMSPGEFYNYLLDLES